MERQKILPVLLFAGAAMALNTTPVWAQSSGGSSGVEQQRSKDTSSGGNQSKRAGDSDTPLAPGSHSGVEKTPGVSQSPRQDKDTSIGGTQSRREGDSDTPQAPGRFSSGSNDPSSSSRGVRSPSQGLNSQQDVRQAQEALKAQGHDPGPIDGVMGPQTRQALREFQSSNGLEQTGMLDAKTKQKLNIESSSR
jgi:hypothetical protein